MMRPLPIGGRPFLLNRGSPQARGLTCWFPGAGEPQSGGGLLDVIASRRSIPTSAIPLIAGESSPFGQSILGGNTQNVIADAGLSPLTGFSLCLWARFTTDLNVINKNAGGFTREYTLGVVTSKSSTIVGVVWDTVTLGNIGRSAPWTFDGVALRHLVLTYTGGTTDAAVAIYLDGRRIDDTDVGSVGFLAYTASAAPLEILSDSGGRWTDFRIYSRALTAADIWALYDPLTRWDLYHPSRARVFFEVGAAADVTWLPQGSGIHRARSSLTASGSSH